MYFVEPCVLAPYLDLDDFLVLIKVNTEWKTWIEDNLKSLSLWHGLPFVPSENTSCMMFALIEQGIIASTVTLYSPSLFMELYAISFWSANKLLGYATENQDERLILEAKKRYACDTQDKLLTGYSVENDGFKTHSLKRFKKYISTLSLVEFHKNIHNILTMHCGCLSYEIAMYILETYSSNYYIADTQFITFCQENDITVNVWNEHIRLVIEQTDCTKEEAITALKLTNDDVVNAIMYLT